MTEIESENIDSENIIKAQIVAIFKNGKSWTPPAESKRINPETGIYNNKPNDPEYFNKYYNEKIECLSYVLNAHAWYRN